MRTKSQVPPYAKYLVHLTRPFPDFDFSFIKPVRRKAVELLDLKPGDRVIDAGCGSGGSFPFLLDAVGAAGEVVGIEISPETCVNTRKRIERNGWANVELVEAPAQEAGLEGKFAGLLMFAAPDVFASDNALDNILPYLKDDARVVFFGAKVPESRFGRVAGAALRKLMKTVSPATPRPDSKPWDVLEKRLGEITVDEYFFGLMFLASGRLGR